MPLQKPVARFVFGSFEYRVCYSVYENDGKFEVQWHTDDEGGDFGKPFDTLNDAYMAILNRFRTI